ncbi:MAG: M24 family metallopeptidase [Terriglobia bacterium]|jgi:Xaa-Pro aminopeptidase
MNLEDIQLALREAKLDGWLFYDHHRRDPIAYRVLDINPVMCTRRWYYLIPREGEPAKLVHRIEAHNLEGLPGTEERYSSWREQREGVSRLLHGKERVAMQYSALNNIPYVGLVDAGTVDLVESCGVDVISSADLVQQFEAKWSEEQWQSHLAAGQVVHKAVRTAFAAIRTAVGAGKEISEYDVQQEMVHVFEANGIIADEPPCVAVNANSADPHYSPSREKSLAIHPGDLVLLDVWGKENKPGAVYFDITWTGYVDDKVPEQYTKVFDVVREARDAAITLVQNALQAGRILCGYEVDDAAREVIERKGYGTFFVHRTGHSIGEDVHGNGANMDNFETHDERRIIARTCFSIEPGIYLHEFGIRSEVNVFAGARDACVTGEIQIEIVPILAAP